MSTSEMTDAQLRETWARVFNSVRGELDVATVWLAMQAAVPVALDGPFFAVGLAAGNDYLATNLQGADASAAIEAGLLSVTGRVLSFQLIEGTTLADWQRQKPATAQAAPPPSAPVSPPPAPTAPSSASRRTAPRDVAPTWDKLTENLAHGYKAALFTKYVPGQARFLLQAAQMISDTMDVLLPDDGDTPDEQGERQLAKVLERFGSVVNLDPLFIMLEVLRLRARQGR